MIDSDAEGEQMVRTGATGRLLRAGAGVDEGLIQRAWTDRHRYTGLGGIVFGTAAMAAASMLLAIGLMVDEFRWYYGFGPALWGLLVFNLDRWLVSSTHGVGRPWKLLPRLAIAVLFGFVIAEPVVLWVFRDAIEEKVIDDRAEEVDTAVSQLKMCNPEDDPVGAAARRQDPSCEGFIVERTIPAVSELTVTNGANVSATDMGSVLRDRQERLLEDIARIDAEIAELEESNRISQDRYEREIRGDGDLDTTGRPGVGPVAAAIQDTILQREKDIEELKAERSTILADVGEIDAELAELEAAQVARAEASEAERAGEQANIDARLVEYAEETSVAVSERIEDIRQRNGDEIGLLQRFDALSELSGEHRHIWIARWLLTSLLIAVDSMPVIAKAIGGKSTYDRLFSTALSADEAGFSALSTASTKRDLREIDLEEYRESLQREVSRQRATVEATSMIFESDDVLERLYTDRGLEWRRRDVAFSEGGVLRTVSIPAVRSGVSTGEPRSFEASELHGGAADNGIDAPREAESNHRNSRDVSYRAASGARANHVDSSAVIDLRDPPANASHSSKTSRSVGTSEADWLTEFAASLDDIEPRLNQ